MSEQRYVMANKKTQKKKLLEELGRKQIMVQDLKNAKFYQYKETINETEYVFQYCGKRRALQIMDESTDKDNKNSKEKLIENMLKEIVVSPSVDLDYFDEPEHMEDFDRVVEVANIILSGKFRNNENLKSQK